MATWFQDDKNAGEAQPARKEPAARKKAKKAAPTEVLEHAPPMLHPMPGDEHHTPAPFHIVWYRRHVIRAVQDKGEYVEVPAEDAEDAAQPGRPIGVCPPLQQAHRL